METHQVAPISAKAALLATAASLQLDLDTDKAAGRQHVHDASGTLALHRARTNAASTCHYVRGRIWHYVRRPHIC